MVDGVWIGGGAYVNMNGGQISSNESDGNGAGVAAFGGVPSIVDPNVLRTATFTMNGGTIANNTTEHSGGGVWTYRAVEVTINDGE